MRFPLFGGTINNPDSVATTVYHYLGGTSSIAWSATELLRQIPLSDDMAVTTFTVTVATAPGTGKSRTYTVRKNGAATAATLTLAGTETTATWTGSVAFVAGDLVALEEVATNTPTNPSRSFWHMTADTTGTKFLLLGAYSGAPSTSAVNYADPFGGITYVGTNAAHDTVVPMACTATKAAVLATVAPGAAKSYAASLRVNGTTDALTATISGTNTTATATGSQTLAAGDTLGFKSAPSGTPAATQLAWCYTIVPATLGESFAGYGSGQNLSTTATQYQEPLGVGGSSWGNESTHQLRLPGVSVKNLYAYLSAAPGLTTSRTFTWRDNAAGSTLTVTISGLATTGNDTAHTVVHTGNDPVGMESSLTGTPAVATAHFGYVLVTEQPHAGTATLTATAPAITGAGTAAKSGTAATITATASLTGAGAAKRSGSAAALTATPALTGAGTAAKSGAATIAASASVTATGTAARAGTATALTATPALTGEGQVGDAGSGTISATPVLTGAGFATRAGNGTLTGTPTVAGGGVANRHGTAALAATAVVTGAGGAAKSGAGAINATVVISAVGGGHRAGDATISGTPTVTGAGGSTRAGTATLAAGPVVMVGAGGRLIEIREPTGLALAGTGRQGVTITDPARGVTVQPSTTGLDITS